MDPARRRRRGDDSSIVGYVWLASAFLFVPLGLVLGMTTGHWFVSGVLLATTALLAVPFLLLRRDARLRRAHGRDTAGRSARSGETGAGGTSEIVVTRAAGYYQDSLRAYRVLVDGRVAGRVRRGGTLRCAVQPGRHTVAARIDWSGSRAVDVVVPMGGAVHLTVVPAGRLFTGMLTRDAWLNLTIDD